jgi:hypothetical protein
MDGMSKRTPGPWFTFANGQCVGGPVGTIDHTEKAGQMLIDGARELAEARAACAQAAQALASWRRAFPDAWGLADQVALAACVRASGA